MLQKSLIASHTSRSPFLNRCQLDNRGAGSVTVIGCGSTAGRTLTIRPRPLMVSSTTRSIQAACRCCLCRAAARSARRWFIENKSGLRPPRPCRTSRQRTRKRQPRRRRAARGKTSRLDRRCSESSSTILRKMPAAARRTPVPSQRRASFSGTCRRNRARFRFRRIALLREARASQVAALAHFRFPRTRDLGRRW